MIQEALNGMRVVQAFGMERYESRRFAHANRGLVRTTAIVATPPDGSVVDLVAVLGKEVTVEEVNAAFKKSADQGKFEGVPYASPLRNCPIARMPIAASTPKAVESSKGASAMPRR